MLRPATPLTLIFLVAFVLLLLSTLSTPIIKGIPLASYQGYNFGVFGWCKGSKCSLINIGYTTDGLFSGSSAQDFSLPASTRHSLSSILIVHPIATFLTLICLGLAVAAHFHSPSSSPRYLLALLILTVPTLLVTLLAFLVDILLFVPHMQWGGWIVLAATILIIASSAVTCAMRRTLVSRKARQKRIAENADMNGTNYYENLNNNRMMADSQLPRADSPPPMSGSTVVDKSIPAFAAFEMKHTNTPSRDGLETRSMNDDRVPLYPNPSIRSRSTEGGRSRPYEDAPPMPRRSLESQGRRPYEQAPPMPRPSMDSQGQPRRPIRDQYVVPDEYGNIPPRSLRREGSDGSLGSRGSRGSRGRGRGGYGLSGPTGPYGLPTPNGGYGQTRGTWQPRRGDRGGNRGRYRGGPPPPGWNSSRGRGNYGPPLGSRDAMPRPPPPDYANESYFGAAAVPYQSPRGDPSPTLERSATQDEFVAGPMDMPIGQAIEMDERTGSPPGPLSPTNPAAFESQQQNYGLRDSDADVMGMVGLQQGQEQRAAPMRMDSMESGQRSPTSIYSEQTYVPPRTHWQPQQLQQRQYATSPLAAGSLDNSSNSNQPSSRALPLSPVQASPTSPQNQHVRAGSESYYEDVDPRFAVVEPSDDGYRESGALPAALTPGGLPPGAITHLPGAYPATPGTQQPQYSYRTQAPVPNPDYLHPQYAGGAVGANDSRSPSEPSLDQAHVSGGSYDGSTSERASEASHFTSISERPVNPNWRPGSVSGGSAYGGAPSSAAAVQRRREDVILNGNPDFSLPGMRGGRGRAGTGGGIPAASAVGGGLTPMGRYPTDI